MHDLLDSSLQKTKKLFTYFLRSDLKILYNKYEYKILFYNKWTSIYFYLTNYYYIFLNNNNYIFLFDLKKDFYLFFKLFFLYYRKIWKLFYLRLFLRGLGYKIKRVTRRLFYFFFAIKHLFYFYIPNDIYIKNRGRKFFILSFSKMKLNNIFFHLLLLKKMDFYERNKSFVVKNKIFFLKKLK